MENTELVGKKVKLLDTPKGDAQMEKHIGDIMTVEEIDDLGQLHGTWEKVKSSLAIVPEVDKFEVIE